MMHYHQTALRIASIISVITALLAAYNGIEYGNTQDAFFRASLFMLIAAVLWWRSMEVDKDKRE